MKRTPKQYYRAALKVFVVGMVITAIGFALQGAMNYEGPNSSTPGNPIPWMQWIIWPSWVIAGIGGVIAVFGSLYLLCRGLESR